VIDPANRFDAPADVLIVDGKIAAVGPNLTSRATPETKVLDVAGKVVCPGLIDLHVHLRDPGQTAKETIGSGTMAAARVASPLWSACQIHPGHRYGRYSSPHPWEGRS